MSRKEARQLAYDQACQELESILRRFFLDDLLTLQALVHSFRNTPNPIPLKDMQAGFYDFANSVDDLNDEVQQIGQFPEQDMYLPNWEEEF